MFDLLLGPKNHMKIAEIWVCCRWHLILLDLIVLVSERHCMMILYEYNEQADMKCMINTY